MILYFLHPMEDSPDKFINLMGQGVKQFKEYPVLWEEILVPIKETQITSFLLINN